MFLRHEPRVRDRGSLGQRLLVAGSSNARPHSHGKEGLPRRGNGIHQGPGTYPDNSDFAAACRRLQLRGKPFQALYEYARAAAVDPTLGKTTDGPKFSASVKKMYVTLHGGEDGFIKFRPTREGDPYPRAQFQD